MLAAYRGSWKNILIVGLVVALAWTSLAYYRYARLRNAVDILRDAVEGDNDDSRRAREYLAARGRPYLRWLVREAAISGSDYDLPVILATICKPKLDDKVDWGDIASKPPMPPSLPYLYRLREVAVYRVCCGNQPEYVDFLIEVIESAEFDPCLGWHGARVAISSLNVAAGTSFSLPSAELRLDANGFVERDGDERARQRARETTNRILAGIKDWWRKNRSSWTEMCKGRDVSGLTLANRFTFVDAAIWNEVLPDDAQLALPRGQSDTVIPDR